MSDKMELDVHLTRADEESWGFRLIGGKDSNMPLTVAKVVPGSPAQKAGLENGDVVCHINGTDTINHSHDSGKDIVDGAKENLTLGVARGLYDPVLDDYEPIYEPIDQEDFDQPSQPTEVQPFQIQQFLDPKPCPEELSELRDIETPFDLTRLIEPRSLTASPFVLPTKPYRPFSTEPLPVPALEDPIILNPNYKDQFGKFEDGEMFPATKFKLPISEQYDPDGSKRKAKGGRDCSVIVSKEATYEERVKEETKISKEMQHKTMVEEVKFMEKMRKDIDLNKIEMTAVNLVDESIERAVSVADDIKKEIEVEISESISSAKESVSVKESTSQKESATHLSKTSDKVNKEASELVDIIDKTTDEIISYNGTKSEVSVAKEVEKFEIVDKKEMVIDERRQSTKQEIQETIVSGTVRRQSEVFDKKLDEKSSETKQVLHNKSEHGVNKTVAAKAITVENKSHKEKTKEVKKESVSSSQTESKASADVKTSSAHRAYTIGLQTIPNIKGSIHSSYHYNLLLKTFFIHLTDVMVALSRFILSEPVFNKEENQEPTKCSTEYTAVTETSLNEKQEEQKETVVAAKDEVVSKKDSHVLATEEAIVEEQATIQEVAALAQEFTQGGVIEYAQAKEDIKEYLEVEEVAETRMLSGAQMAQLSEKKSEELTHKMDAVITEFQVKAGIEETIETRERRSRSRSRIEEEVARESDPLVWLSKVDQKQTQEVTKLTSQTKSFSSSSELIEKKRVESKQEKRETITSNTKDGKQMYVAIVESHVFTNKDAIFEEEALEFSETSSIQSADEINIALVANEITATEKVVLQNTDMKQEEAKTVLEESRDLAIVNARTENVEIAEEIKAIVEKAIQEVAIQEVVEPVVEIQEMKIVELKEDFQKVDIKHEEHFMAISEKTDIVEEQKNELIELHEVKKEEQVVTIKEEEHVMTVSEKTEIAVAESAQEAIEIPEVKKEVAIAITEENLDSYVEEAKKEIEIIEPVIEEVFTELSIKAKPAPTLEEASAELKIVKEQIVEMEQTLKLTEESELSINKYTEMIENGDRFSAIHNNIKQCFESKEMIQESSFTARADRSKLSLQLDLGQQRRFQSQSSIQSDPASTINTPTPATVPPTPLTDEYVFKLHAPMPKESTPAPGSSADHEDPNIVKKREDPNIVKKKLIPYINTTLDSPIIYDPPLASPPLDANFPVYTKPGLKGGALRPLYNRRQEEILEIERKSSLLATAIDETIKSIEEYKEEVGIDIKKEVRTEKNDVIDLRDQPVLYNGFAKLETILFDVNTEESKINKEWKHINNQVCESNASLNEISKSVITKVNQLGIETNKTMPIKETNTAACDESPSNLVCNGNARHFNNIENADSSKYDAVLVNGVVSEKSDLSVSEIVRPLELRTATVNNTSSAKCQGEEIQVTKENDVKAEEDTEIKKEEKIKDVEVRKEEPELKRDPLEGYKPVQFNPEELIAAKKNLQSIHLQVKPTMQRETSPGYMDESGELIGTHQGIVDGLEGAVVDAEVAKDLGKPGMTEDKIAELISGESEMLREAHVMGLSRVLSSHMHRPDDSSVDFKKIKPIIESLKDSEVLKALNDELIRTREEKKKKEERKWTTFLQKPSRPVPKAKFGYHGYVEPEEVAENPYTVKIIKQPKPKVAPDFKPKNFETGPLPWEERALNEPPPPPVDPEEPILIPEELPEFLEAVDPLPETEVPDLEDTGIPLPPPAEEEPESTLVEGIQEEPKEELEEEPVEELDIEAVLEETERIVEEMEQNRLAEQLLTGVQNMVDPNASVDQQLSQMRAQLAALAQLPGVIQQTLELVTRQLTHLTQQDITQKAISDPQMIAETVPQETTEVDQSETNGEAKEHTEEPQQAVIEEVVEATEALEEQPTPNITQEEMDKLKQEEDEMLEEQRRIEKQKKEFLKQELMEQMRIEQESRQVKQRPTPRVGKPKPVFGPAVPQERPLVLPGGRKWRKPQDAYNEQFIAETLTAQAEIIRGKVKGSYESDKLPYDERINFMKYEKPPVSLDHLQQSEVYKLIHNMEQTPAKRVEMLTPVVAEADYREKCRSMTPSSMDNHTNYPQQVQP